MFTLKLFFLYSLICSVGLLLMYGAIRFSRVSTLPRGRWAILWSVLTVALASALPLALGWTLRPTVVRVVFEPAVVALANVADDAPSDALTPQWSWWNIILAVYAVGLLFSVIRLAVTIGRIMLTALKSERRGSVLLSRKSDIVPFSWGGRIFMALDDYAASSGSMLLAHEDAHRRAHHWLDLLFLNLVGCLTWYCPAVRLIRRELQMAHEFAADRAVIAAGFDAREYQMLLISKATGRRFANSVADCINNHSLKKRIIMMQKNSSSRHPLLRNLTLVPAALTVIALASSPALASMVGSAMPAKVVVSEQPKPAAEALIVETESVPEPETVAVAVTPQKPITILSEDLVVVDDPVEPARKEETKDEKVFTAVEVSPKFPGGEMAMYEHMTKTLRYPEECIKKDIQGRVVVQFVVKKDGSIGEVKVVRPQNELLDAEAIRVVRTFPKFTPGTMNGEPVNVWYTLPVMFKLTDDKASTKTKE